jgi:predicted ATPase
MQSDKVGIVEIMEENKMVRHKSVDENWNLFLDRSLTMMLSNVVQFAPALESWTETVD